MEGSNCDCSVVLLSQHLGKGSEENHKTEVRTANDLAKIWSRYFSKKCQEHYCYASSSGKLTGTEKLTKTPLQIYEYWKEQKKRNSTNIGKWSMCLSKKKSGRKCGIFCHNMHVILIATSLMKSDVYKSRLSVKWKEL